MKSDILIASNNPDKLIELKALFATLPLNLHSLSEFPDMPATIEDQDTIAGNAMKKAMEAADYSGMIAIADDTGLFIEALNGEPGVYAARFAGENCSYADNRRKALDMLKGNPKRSASFRTAVAMASPEGIISVVEGKVEGVITESERGDSGFGYDSIFAINGITYAEMNADTKNRCSHRAEAVKAVIPIIERLVVSE
jgi:XTP/dITP diphosphohydrolase